MPLGIHDLSQATEYQRCTSRTATPRPASPLNRLGRPDGQLKRDPREVVLLEASRAWSRAFGMVNGRPAATTAGHGALAAEYRGLPQGGGNAATRRTPSGRFHDGGPCVLCLNAYPWKLHQRIRISNKRQHVRCNGQRRTPALVGWSWRVPAVVATRASKDPMRAVDRCAGIGPPRRGPAASIVRRQAVATRSAGLVRGPGNNERSRGLARQRITASR